MSYLEDMRLAHGIMTFESGKYDEALNYLQPLARERNSHALYILGIMHRQGKGVKQDNKRALQLFQESNHPWAENDIRELTKN